MNGIVQKSNGETRMDFYTFCAIPRDRIMSTIRERGIQRGRTPIRKGKGGVKEFVR